MHYRRYSTKVAAKARAQANPWWTAKATAHAAESAAKGQEWVCPCSSCVSAKLFGWEPAQAVQKE